MNSRVQTREFSNPTGNGKMLNDAMLRKKKSKFLTSVKIVLYTGFAGKFLLYRTPEHCRRVEEEEEHIKAGCSPLG